jgi:hypothetical protein
MGQVGMTERQQLEQAITHLEAQRAALGDKVCHAWSHKCSVRGEAAYMGEQLRVVVNEELTLAAGWWEEIDGTTKQRIVLRPRPTMFEQVLDYLARVTLRPVRVRR